MIKREITNYCHWWQVSLIVLCKKAAGLKVARDTIEKIKVLESP